MSSVHRAAGHAMSDALWNFVGQFGAMISGLATALIVPRLLGPSDYGDWVLLRGVMSFVVAFSVLGTTEMVARFHVSRVAQGRTEDAAHVFKFLALLRSGLSLLSVAAIFLMAPGRVRMPGGMADLMFLAVGVFVQCQSQSPLLLLYGHREFRRIALFSFLQPAATPLIAVLAYRMVGYPGIPAATAIGDIFVLVLVTMLSARHWRWPAGSLPAADRRALLRFGGVIAFASLGMAAFNNMTPYLMNMRDYSSEAIGYIGLSRRLSLLLIISLSAVGSGMFPSLAHVLHTDGERRMLKWHNLSTRVGLLLCLAASGTIALSIRAWISPIFGSAYAQAAPAVALGITAAIPLWIGGQFNRLALLQHGPRIAVMMTAALLAVFVGLMLCLSPDSNGMHAIYATIWGSAAYATVGAVIFRRTVEWGSMLRRFAGPVALVVLAFYAESLLPSRLLMMLAGAAGWLVLFAAVSLATGAVESSEIRSVVQVIRNLNRRTISSPDEAEKIT